MKIFILFSNWNVSIFQNFQKQTVDKTGVINDPLGQTHSLASSEHCFLLFCVLLDLKSGDGRTDNMCENNYPNYPYPSWL